MFAKLSALVGSSSSLPFEIVEEYGHGWGHWTHSAGKMYADGSRVSVFRISAESETDPKLIAARNGVKRLKMVRWHLYCHFFLGSTLAVGGPFKERLLAPYPCVTEVKICKILLWI